MKAIVCEMCGSQDLVKQDGFYVCQNCGTKYSPDEAKKLMIDGVVDVSGSTVHIDETNQLNKLLELAHRAEETGNTENAQKYYGQIVLIDPDNWEAFFKSTYYQQLGCKIYQIEGAADRIKYSVGPTLDLIATKVYPDEQGSAYAKVARKCIDSARVLKTAAYNHYISNSQANGAQREYYARATACANLLYSSAIEFELRGQTDEAELLFFEVSSRAYNAFLSQSTMDSITNKMKKYDPNYNPPKKATKSGCYVATAVYGSYDCPQVWTLRRYRDYTLAETWYGRAFIRTYYAISPTLVKWFGKTEWFKNLWKPKLDRMVERLNRDGVDATPYSDRNW